MSGVVVVSIISWQQESPGFKSTSRLCRLCIFFLYPHGCSLGDLDLVQNCNPKLDK